MSSIYFNLNIIQEKELQIFMEKEGYTNKSEFFRFLLKFYKYHQFASLEQSPQMAPIIQASPQSPIDTTIIHNDENLSPEKRELLNNPHIFDEEVRQLIRDMEE